MTRNVELYERTMNCTCSSKWNLTRQAKYARVTYKNCQKYVLIKLGSFAT